MSGNRRKAPYLAFMDNTRVRDAFAYLTKHKESYIVREEGKVVEVREAVRRYKETGDDKWVMHILMSNLGYFANALSKVAAKYNVDVEDYVFCVYEGLRKSMDRAEPNIVRLSYLSTGVFMYARKLAEAEALKRAKEEALLGVSNDSEDGEASISDADMALAALGIYDVSLYDEDTQQSV